MKKLLPLLLLIIFLLTSCTMEGFPSVGYPVNNYVITFNPNNNDEIFTQTVELNNLVSEPLEPVYQGHTFLGWFNNDVKWNFNIDVVTCNLILTAKWRINEVVEDKGYQDVSFTGNNVSFKNVADIDYYDGSTMSIGSPKVLVIPVEFSDALATTKGYTIDVIEKAFLSQEETNANLDYCSVYDYFYTSSYGKLSLDITVINEWFKPSKPSTYYENLTDSQNNFIGDQYVMDEALTYLASKYDLSEYDANQDYVIDAVVMVNTLDISDESDFYWAFQYYNQMADDEGYLYEYDSVCADVYLWASYGFLYESEIGVFDNQTPTNTYTFIHEFSHVLGADDYYDYSGKELHPLDGHDIMDNMIADHNPFTKMHLGWINGSKLITTDSQVTINLSAFEKSGDTVLIASNYNAKMGCYQEYWLVVYYNQTKLNSSPYGLFKPGIVVYHVNASVSSEVYEGKPYYYLTNTNTDSSDEYGSVDNLIEFQKNGYQFTYTVSDRLTSNILSDNNEKIPYTFVVDSLNSEEATITFTKNA